MLKLAFAILVLASTTATAAPSMKGWELYSWFDSKCSDKPQVHSAPNADTMCFALVVGTNRTKTEAEIKRTPMTLQKLEAKLKTLAKGEEVFWSAPSSRFVLPDAKQSSTNPLRRARAMIEKLGLVLTIVRAP